MTRTFDWSWLDADRPFKLPDPWTGSLLSRKGYGSIGPKAARDEQQATNEFFGRVVEAAADRYVTTSNRPPSVVNDAVVAQNKDRITFATREALAARAMLEPEFFQWVIFSFGLPRYRECRQRQVHDRADHIACKIPRPFTLAPLCATSPKQAAIVRDIEERVAMKRILDGIEEARVALVEEPE